MMTLRLSKKKNSPDAPRLTGKEKVAHGDAGCIGMDRREELAAHCVK